MARWVNGKVVIRSAGNEQWVCWGWNGSAGSGPGESSAFMANAIHRRPAMIMWIEEPHLHSPSPPAHLPLGESGERVHSGDERLKRRTGLQAIA